MENPQIDRPLDSQGAAITSYKREELERHYLLAIGPWSRVQIAAELERRDDIVAFYHRHRELNHS